MMTDEELAAIRARAEAAYRWVWRDRTQDGPRSDAAERLAQGYSQDMPALLAEVGCLRERVAALEAVRDAASANVQRLMEREMAMRAIIERVAAMTTDGIDPTAPYHEMVTAARTLLATEGE